ncbi:hypothetical protein MA16_Dca028612 [Dendrobium catenatum]|uniref:Uncharacterized protein n=1 Tax=Dendrobium catenatum TaxID=906689 RepID=A0A2I0VAA3_9ASPA|nr:hypothetical protein MA16_Dca028612 [Dendrobium catenatum]
MFSGEIKVTAKVVLNCKLPVPSHTVQTCSIRWIIPGPISLTPTLIPDPWHP